MWRILFLVLSVFLIFGPQAQGDVEIYINGHKYDSMKTYLASEKSAAVSSALSTAELNSQQEDYIRKEAQNLGIKVDFSKVKTFQVNQKRLSDPALHQLYVLSVENGVVGALKSFYQTWGQPDSKITPEQLQDVIQKTVSTSKDPKLLISEPGKVRIMSLATQDSSK